jgi:hypothetical protein
MSTLEIPSSETLSTLKVVARDSVATRYHQALADEKVRVASARLLEVLKATDASIRPRDEGPVACPGASYSWHKKSPALA